MTKPETVKNMDSKIVQIVQVGWGGINIGRIDYFFDQKFCVKKIKGNSFFVKKH